MEGIKMAAKSSYWWKTEFAWRKQRLVIFVTVGWILPCGQRKPGCRSPVTKVEATKIVPYNHWVPLRAIPKYPDCVTSQCQTSHCPLM